MRFDPDETAIGSPRAGTTSSRLLQGLRLRSETSWKRLTSLYGPLVFFWCRRHGLDDADSADVFQEVFSAIWLGIAGFQHEPHRGRFRTWLWTIARHKISDHYRRQAALGGRTEELGEVAIPEQPPEDSEADHKHELQGLFRRAVETVRADFENRTWEAFWRVTVEGQPCAEVAAALAMSRNGVRQAKSRVLRRLREEMGDLLL